mgnify:CR=1 FL=1
MAYSDICSTSFIVSPRHKSLLPAVWHETPDQAVWRRAKIAESSLDAFHEEFPSTFEESCIVTGSSVFDNSKVFRLQQVIAEKKIVPLALDKLVGLPNVLRSHDFVIFI